MVSSSRLRTCKEPGIVISSAGGAGTYPTDYFSPRSTVSANADEAAGGDDGTASAESDAENDTDTDTDSDTESDSDTVTGADTADPDTDAEGAADPADDAAVESTRTVETAAEAPAAEAANEIVVEASGSFSGNSRYDVTGEAEVLGNGTGQRFLRLENFESDNGPDLNVYLFNPNDSSDFIDLGDLKGNIGDQNYEIPADVDLSVYSEVSIWCVRFGVGFGSADLMSA